MWHRRLGHVNFHDLKTLINESYIKGLSSDFKDPPPCEICITGKLTRLPFPKRSETSAKPLEIIHTDLCGPMRITSQGGARYFLTFTDEYSRWTDVYFLRSKDEVPGKFAEYKSQIEIQTGHSIKALQSDNGKEFCNSRLDDILKRSGIRRRLTTPHTPQQNGIAERKNRTLVEMARCMLLESGMPPSLWAEAINTANYIRNRCPSRSLDAGTPYEKRTGLRPSLHFLQIFGCKAFVLDKAPGKGKFSARAIRGSLVGYSEVSKGFRIWIPSEKRVRVTWDVKFVEEFGPNEYSDFISESTTSGKHTFFDKETRLDATIEIDQKEDDNRQIKIEINPSDEPVDKTKPNQTPDMNPDHQTQSSVKDPGSEAHNEKRGQKRAPGRPSTIATGKPGRPMKKYRYQDTQTIREEEDTNVMRQELEYDSEESEPEFKGFEPTPYVHKNGDEPYWQDAEMAMSCSEIPLSAALSGPHGDEWKRAIYDETRSLIENDAWRIVNRPHDRNVIGSRTVLQNKFKSDGTLDRRKARIVAKGYAQSPGIDYFDSYSPVARLSSFRVLMALSAKFNLNMTQLDVTTAFLYGDIDVELFMELPELFEETISAILREEKDPLILNRAHEMSQKLIRGNQVCKLNRAIYGLKQAGRQWHEKMTSVLQDAGLSPTHSDPCLYTDEHKRTFVLVYVDDLLIATTDRLKEKRIIDILSRHFKIKNLGQPKFCLGIEINQSRGSVRISQSGYIQELLARFHMTDCKPVSTPLAVGSNLHNFSGNEEEPAQKPPYRALIGALMYLAVATRPDIAHAVSVLSQFNEKHRNAHWIAAKRVLRYLQGTIDQSLTYASDDHALRGYVDADWANCSSDRRSYTGFTFLPAGAAITWESRKQRTVALSSTEAEYLGLSAAAKESVYLIHLMKELGFEAIASVKLFNDNNGAIELAENPSFHPKTKHIDIRHHYIREVLRRESVVLSHMSTDLMIADVLTKGLPRAKHDFCSREMGITSAKNRDSSN